MKRKNGRQNQKAHSECEQVTTSPRQRLEEQIGAALRRWDVLFKADLVTVAAGKDIPERWK